MPSADAVLIASYADRKAAVFRAAQIFASPRGSELERELERLTEAIVAFDMEQAEKEFVEIPLAFMQFLGRRERGAAGATR